MLARIVSFVDGVVGLYDQLPARNVFRDLVGMKFERQASPARRQSPVRDGAVRDFQDSAPPRVCCTRINARLQYSRC